MSSNKSVGSCVGLKMALSGTKLKTGWSELRTGVAGCRVTGHGCGEVMWLDYLFFTGDREPLDHIVQFSDIAWPRVASEDRERGWGNGLYTGAAFTLARSKKIKRIGSISSARSRSGAMRSDRRSIDNTGRGGSGLL